jgi:hypothetical protein
MAFTDIEKVRIEIGDTDAAMPILSDDEIQYFLDKNEGSIRKASLDCAKSILFRLAAFTFERVDILEYRGSDYFAQYRKALEMFISNPEYGSVSNAMGYAGGISISDIQANINDSDVNYVKVEKSIPTDNTAYNLNNDSAFSQREQTPFGF